MRRLDQASTLLFGLSAMWIAGCLDQPTKIEIVEPTGAVVFDSPKDFADIHIAVRDEEGRLIQRPQIHWSSSNPRVAAISWTGRVTPKRDGRAAITARVGYVEKDIPIVVRFFSILKPSPDRIAVSVDEQARITAELFDADGAHMSGTLMWTSRDPSVATVDQTGLVTGRAPGATAIDVSIKHLSATVWVEVAPLSTSS
jgi:Big-like domain-containing protein